jgi:hypothetical protein
MAEDKSADRRREQNCEVVHRYLRAEFPDNVPVETPDPTLGGLIFRIQGASLGWVWFDDTFLEDTEPRDTGRLLRRENIAARMRKAVKGKTLRVTSHGVMEKD